MRTLTCTGLTAALGLFLSTGALAHPSTTGTAGGDDTTSWAQWLGPNKDSLSRETDWTNEGKELWQLEVGMGYSSVIVADGKLYTKGFDKDAGLDLIWCVDAASGEELWVSTYEAKIWDLYHTGGTLSTPTLDGDVLFVLNREGNLHAFDAATGEPLWEKALADEHGVEPPTWGFSASPLVIGDELIINVGKLLSLDKKTGEVRWKTKDYGAAYSTPRAFERDGKPLLAVFNAGLSILSRTDGSELASMEWKTEYDVNAATPIIAPDGGIFISSGYNHGCAMVDFTGEKLVTRWENKLLRNHMSGSVLIGEHLYGFDDNELTCIDLDGEQVWNERSLRKGALMGTVDERLIVIGGEGELVIADATPDGYSSHTSVDLFDDGVCWTRPVIAGGRIYVRNSFGKLICRDHRPQAD